MLRLHVVQILLLYAMTRVKYSLPIKDNVAYKCMAFANQLIAKVLTVKLLQDHNINQVALCKVAWKGCRGGQSQY